MNSLIVAANLIKRAFRAKRELAALIILPIAVVAMMTMVMSSVSESRTVVGIVNLDTGALGHFIVQHIQGKGQFEAVVMDSKDYKVAVAGKKAAFAAVIPADFTEAVRSGLPAQVTIYSGQESMELASFRQSLNQYIELLYTVEERAEAAGDGREKEAIRHEILANVDSGLLSVEYRVVGNNADSSKEASFASSIGFALVFIMTFAFTVMGTLMEDRRRLTLARIFTAPVHWWEIITGNLLGSLVLGVIQLVPITLVLAGVMGIELMGTVALFAVLFCFLIASVGLSLGLSSILKKGYNPTLVIATVIVPTSIIGGAFIPESMMPELLSRLGYAVPQKWVMDAVYVILDGAGVSSVLTNLSVLVLFGFVFATFGTKTIRPLES